MSTASDISSFTELTLTPPQWDFLQLDCKHPAFVAGFGTGKSQTLAVSAVIDRRFIAVRLLWVMNSRRPDLCLTAQDFRFAITGGFVVLRSTP